MDISLYDHQQEALKKMHNGCILCGGTGSGKSRTALAYYYKEQCGCLDTTTFFKSHPKDLYIITTAKKRDSMDWEVDMAPFLLSSKKDALMSNKVVVDSWNNIKKYKDVKNAFFIFDEQRVVGYGAWSKTFINITKANKWILLSATPGDKWEDYIPVFIANSFYKNKTEFEREHIIFDPWVKYRKVYRYLSTRRLERLRDRLLVDMDFERRTVPHHEAIFCEYDRMKYHDIYKNRWDPFKDEPICQASSLCYVLRRLVNSDPSRLSAVLDIFEKHKKIIIFYNFDYELDELKSVFLQLTNNISGFKVAEWNGHKHQAIPESKTWVYLVQYTAGCEGWNCITTDTIVFYSQNYSYKVLEQACGRIDRLNTPYIDLYYYHLKSKSGIDLAIGRALKAKKKFNERKFTKWEDKA